MERVDWERWEGGDGGGRRRWLGRGIRVCTV